MITVKNLSKSFGGKRLFQEVNMRLNAGEHGALVGENGTGKTTLFHILLGNEDADAGSAKRDEWTLTGYLPQHAETDMESTVMEIATGRAGALQDIEKELERLEGEGRTDEPEYFDTQSKYEALTDPSLEANAKKMLRGLGFKEEDFTRQIKEMSGGWAMRAHLARLLAMQPDLLLLDEPTNHLDLQSLLWFQDYLKNYPGAVLMISHDREFMDATVDRVFELSHQQIITYKGNYSAHLKQREDNFLRQAAAYKNQQKEVKNIKDFAARFLSVASKAAQAQSKLKQLEKMELVEKPMAARKPFRFQIPQPPRSGQRVISLDTIRMAYGDRLVYDGLDLHIERGERIVLVGPNGSGKSTLMKILANVLPFQSGERTEGHNTKIGYFSQYRTDTLDASRTVLEEVLATAPTIKEDEARGILGSFLFKKDDVFKHTGVLSGGEKSRLNLVKFLVDPPNLLLMDEPTTHLDILSVESLILALEKYEGTLVFISHDVHFIKKLATKVLHVANGVVKSYPGDYDYFVQKTGGLLSDREALVAAS